MIAMQATPRYRPCAIPHTVRDVQYREYDTPDGYVHAIRQLSQRGYNYFLPVKKTRKRSAMIIGKSTQPRKADRTLQ